MKKHEIKSNIIGIDIIVHKTYNAGEINHHLTLKTGNNAVTILDNIVLLDEIITKDLTPTQPHMLDDEIPIGAIFGKFNSTVPYLYLVLKNGKILVKTFGNTVTIAPNSTLYATLTI